MIDDVTEGSRHTILPACTILDWVAVCFASFATAVIGSLIGAAIGGTGSLTEISGGLLGLWAAIVPSAVLLSRRRGTGSLATDFGLRINLRRDWVGVPVGIGAQLVVLPLIYVLLELISRTDLTDNLGDPAKELTHQASGGAPFVLLAVLLIVGAPIVEEIFYRGMLFSALRARFGLAVTIVLCGIVFGLVHLQLLQFAGLAVSGMILAWLRARTGTLGAAIVAHATFNAITVAAVAAA